MSVAIAAISDAIHMPITIGRASFAAEALQQNLSALIEALNKSKPNSSKGIYLQKISVSSTMGVGVKVEQSSVSGQQQ